MPFIGVRQKDLGVKSDRVNIYSQNLGGYRLIGYVEEHNLSKWQDGDNTVFTPVDDWKETFSMELIERLGLMGPQRFRFVDLIAEF